MYDLDNTCQGFSFQAYVPGPDGRPIPAPDGVGFAAAEDTFLEKLNWMLRGRPDLIELLSCLDTPLDVRIHCGTGFFDEDGHVYLYGRVTDEGDGLVLEIATDEVREGGRDGHDVLDVVIHEMTHVLDMIGEDDDPGLLPWWSAEQRALFVRLREAEKPAIADGRSAIDRYALTSDMEFLAVTVETFFVLPAELKKTSPGLYDLLADYFVVDAQQEAATLAMMSPVVV